MDASEKRILKLLDTLSTETLLLEKYRDREEELRIYMKEKDWQGMNQLLERLDLLSNEINSLDQRRDLIFHELLGEYGVRETGDFYQLVIRLPQPWQEKLAAVFRRMKVTITQIEGISWAIDVYIRTIGESMNQILNEFYPHRKGKIYSRTGHSVPVNSNPMILNREL